MIKKKKLFKRPKKLFESFRIKEENELAKKYGLKNKKEIWKALARVNYIRKRAMALARMPLGEQESLFGKLRGLGLKAGNTADVLGLQVEDILNRRLPTIIFKKGMARTLKQARQLVVHKKVLIDKKAVNSPSYLVHLAEEGKISIKEQKPKKEKPAEQPAETQEQQVKEAKENA